MRELSRVLRQPAFHLLLLAVALVVFCKPMLLPTSSESAGQVVLQLFVPWALVVVVLFLIARSSDEPPHVQDDGAGKEDAAGEPERD